MLRIAVELVSDAQERSVVDAVLAVLDHELVRQRHWGVRYAVAHDRCVELRMLLVKRFDGEQAVREFLLAHRQVEPIRRQLIRMYIEENEPAKALQLVEEAIQQSRKSGLETQVREYRLQRISLLEMLGDTAQLVRVLQDEWLVSRRPEDYLQLRAKVSTEDWPQIRRKLAASLKRDPQLAAWMWAQDGVWDEVLKIAQADLRHVVVFRPDLEQRFPEKMADLYQRQIHIVLANSFTYWDNEVVIFLKAMKNMGLEQRVQTLVEEITRKHPKRTGLLKALRQL
jgi:hypothetical protein